MHNNLELLKQQQQDHSETVAALLLKPLWGTSDLATYCGVSSQYYRRYLLPLAQHPDPIDPRKRKWEWWRDVARPFLDDKENLKFIGRGAA
jgi:hypothetical protein